MQDGCIGWGRCVFEECLWGWVCVSEWVLDKWSSLDDITHCKHEVSVLNKIWPKCELSESWKNII